MKNIYLDFDGTVVEHAYPRIGRYNAPALEVIKKLQDKGHRIILNTTRVMFKDGSLQAALIYLNKHPQVNGIHIRLHTSHKINPPRWCKESLKQAAEIYIDDMADGIPKTKTAVNGYMVNWQEVEKQLTEAGIIDK